MYGKVVELGDKLESGLAKYAVHLEVEPDIGAIGIGAIGIGPITGSISRAWVEYGGVEVSEVPEGENFVVKASFTASNPGFSIKPWDPGWSTAITAISTDGKVKGGDPTNQYAAYQSEVASVSLGPMPANDITLRVKLWGNQDMWTSPGVPDLPPQADW